MPLQLDLAMVSQLIFISPSPLWLWYSDLTMILTAVKQRMEVSEHQRELSNNADLGNWLIHQLFCSINVNWTLMVSWALFWALEIQGRARDKVSRAHILFCAYKAWVISPSSPHPLPYHPLRPLPLPPPPQYPAETILPLSLILL
jgi:hypothetical protein